MKKLLTICTTLLCFLGMVGCGDDATTGNGNKVRPIIVITNLEAPSGTLYFDVKTNKPGTFAYSVVDKGAKQPSIDELFAANTVEIENEENITVRGLSQNTDYTLYGVLRTKEDGVESLLKKVDFTTGNEDETNPITIDEIGYTEATFTINLTGNIVFFCIDKAFLEHENMTPEDYLTTPGWPIKDRGPLTVDWIDGNSYGPYEMRMREDSDYYVIAANCDDATPTPNITGRIYIKEFRTLKSESSTAAVTTELKDITSSSVTIATTPDTNILEYYVYVRDKAWTDGIIGGYGEGMLATLIKSSNAGAWRFNSANESTWGGLTPAVTYNCMVLAVDNAGLEALNIYEFNTLESNIDAPEINLSFIEPAENAHNNLKLQVYSELAVSGKYVIRPTADIVARRAALNYTDEQLINNYGKDFTAEEIAKIASTGCVIEANDLWPEVEYTAIVGIKNAESTLTVKATTHTTPKQPAAPRVESELFTSLLGEWVMSYSLVQENGVKANVYDVVTIAQGVDDKTNADYRDQNQLVILGFPFNVNSQGIYEELPVFLPSDLLDEANGALDYYKHGMNLVYRDYGAKIFLQIGEGDVITMPTSKGMYLYNWAKEGYLSFYGCDYDNQWTAPATFPVTLSADGNTLTIGAYQAGEEFGYGTYRPSVFLNDYQLKACATSDITLTRKQ